MVFKFLKFNGGEGELVSIVIRVVKNDQQAQTKNEKTSDTTSDCRHMNVTTCAIELNTTVLIFEKKW